MRLFFILLSTLISNIAMAQEVSTKKVVLEDMGNVGYRITDAQILVDWVTSGIRPRVGRENIMYEGLLKSKKDLQRRLGRTETHDAQSKEIERLEAFAKQAKVWLKARFGKDKRGHWVEVSCRPEAKKTKKFTDKKRFYDKRFASLKPKVTQAMATFCAQLLPLGQASNASSATSSQRPGQGPKVTPRKPKKWLPPQRR